jgi:hypothetical protein
VLAEGDVLVEGDAPPRFKYVPAAHPETLLYVTWSHVYPSAFRLVPSATTTLPAGAHIGQPAVRLGCLRMCKQLVAVTV